MRKAIICLVLVILLSTNVAAASKLEQQVPVNVKLISQSCMSEVLCLTVIDLANNEVVIILYAGTPATLFRGGLKIISVTRTGMFIDPATQNYIIGQDAPYNQNKTIQNQNDHW